MVRNPTMPPGGTRVPAGGSWATTTASPPCGSRAYAPPCRPPARQHPFGLGQGAAEDVGDRIPRVLPGAVRTAGAEVAPVVAGGRALGVDGSSRPARASAASPTSSMAAVATRPDVTLMLVSPSMAGR
jgi:hypothetical protein